MACLGQPLVYTNPYYFHPVQFPVHNPAYRQMPQRPPPGFFGPPAFQSQAMGGGGWFSPPVGFGGGQSSVARPSPPVDAERNEPRPLPSRPSTPRKAPSPDSSIQAEGNAASPRDESPEEATGAKEGDRASISPDLSQTDDESLLDQSIGTSGSRRRKSSTAGISDRMIENFRTILSENPDGVTSSELSNLYMSKFKVPLDYADYGFSSVREMVLHLPKVFVFEKTKLAKDWTLFDARISPKKRVLKESWVPLDILDKLSNLTQDHPQGIKADEIIEMLENRFKIELDVKRLGFKGTLPFLKACKSVTVQKVGEDHVVLPKAWGRTMRESQKPTAPALPPDSQMVDLWASFFKEDECGPFFQYEQPTVPKEKFLKVFISDVFSPHLLWLHDASKVSALRKMMTELDVFYEENERDMIFPEQAVHVNFPCATKFSKDQSWYRAKIVEILNQTEVKVRYVDYGTLDIVGVSELRKLAKRFSVDPMYAYTCKMAGIEPVDVEWPVETAGFLFEYHRRVLFAEFLDPVEPADKKFSINLIDTTKKEGDVSVADLLIKAKLAREIRPREFDRFDVDILRALMTALPFWITESDDTGSHQKDLVFTAQNILAIADPNFIETPLNLDMDPCCDEHYVRAFFLSSPQSTLQLWAAVMTKYRDQMTNDFLRMAHELSSIDRRERNCIHGTRCPVREERATQARRRTTSLMNSHSEPSESTSVQRDTEVPPSVAPSPLANTTVLGSRHSATPLEPTSVPSFAPDSPHLNEEWRHRRANERDPFEMHALRASLPQSAPVNQLPNRSYLNSVPPRAENPHIFNPLATDTHHNHSSLNHAAHATLAPTLPTITRTDVVTPSPSLPTHQVNGYFQQPHDAPISQGVCPPPRPRTGSMTSLSSLRRCKCTTSTVDVELGGQTVHVVQHGDGLFLSCDELLRNFAGSLSNKLIHERLKTGQTLYRFAAVTVHADDHQKLFAELNKSGLLEGGKTDAILFSVREVGNFFRALLPNQPILAQLADEKFGY